MEKETKKRKGGAEKKRERKKKKLKEIAAKCMNIQEAFARASTSTESQTTVNPSLLLEHQLDQHQSVKYHDVPASDLVNQNCSNISISPVSESEVQTVYTKKPEPDRLSQDNPEVCSAPLTQVSEVQQDQSVIPSVTAYHSWFVKPKRDKLTEYFEFLPHQSETTKFNATNVYFRPDDSGGCLQRLWLSYCEEKEALFCNLCIAYITTTSSNQNPSKFLTGFISWKHIYHQIDEHENSQKHKACVKAHMRFSSNKTVVDLLTVSQTSLHKKRSCKEGKFSTESSPL